MSKTFTKRERAYNANFYAIMSGKGAVREMPEQRTVTRAESPDAESGVMTEVRQLLQVHPDVILAVRANSGGAWMKGKGGEQVPVWFYRIVKSPKEVTLVDWWGFARWGFFAIECKRRDWTYSGKGREEKQKNFIDLVIKCGGRAGFVTSAEQAKALLSGD